MEKDISGFAQSLFEYQRAAITFGEVVSLAGFADWTMLDGDDYDSSVEFQEVGNGARLSEEAQRAVYTAGFRKAYLNHEDGWETIYSWEGPDFAAAQPWRRKIEDGRILVGYLPESWEFGQKWVENGKVVVVPEQAE